MPTANDELVHRRREASTGSDLGRICPRARIASWRVQGSSSVKRPEGFGHGPALPSTSRCSPGGGVRRVAVESEINPTISASRTPRKHETVSLELIRLVPSASLSKDEPDEGRRA